MTTTVIVTLEEYQELIRSHGEPIIQSYNKATKQYCVLAKTEIVLKGNY